MTGRLDRVRDALRKRDWPGIGIELAVVTVGVLLAFEIEQWGQRQDRREQERQFMEELYTDTRAGIPELNDLIAVHDKVLQDVPLALDARGDPAKIAALPDQRGFGCGLSRPLPAPYNDTAYEELIQSGRLSLISDPRLRKAVRDLAASQKWGASQDAFYGDQMPINLPPLTPFYHVNVSRDSDIKCKIDWPQLLANDAASDAAIRMLRRHRVMWQVRRRTLELTLETQQLLACKLGKPECRHRG